MSNNNQGEKPQITQGEWQYFKANGNHVISNGVGCIADVYCNENDKDGTEEANAKLIAAAPELLKALNYVKAVIEKNDKWWIDCPDKGGFDLDIITNAINKASTRTK